MILSLAVLLVRYQSDKLQGSFVSLAIPHVVVLHRSPPSPRASQKCDLVMGPPTPPPRWAGGVGEDR